jgi:uncharacterized protein (DUF2062 family)/2-polyprenyl-3-methyl-5-hydroxy-6-metoxy-1,4-benzoquinol methylase
VGLGVLVGCTPFYGFQILLGIAIASLLRLNRLGVVFGAQVSTPPLTPLIAYLGIQVGEFVLRGKFFPLSWAAFAAKPLRQVASELFLDFLIGGLIVGGFLGALGALLTTVVVKRFRSGPRLSSEELAKLKIATAPLPPKFRYYARCKVRLDPIYARILPELKTATRVTDLGAGMGLLPYLLSLRAPSVSVTAVEWDEDKVAAGKVILKDVKSIRWIQSDARHVELDEADAIVMLDLLHYFDFAEQKSLLQRCTRALRPGGMLLIRELAGRKYAGVAERIERWTVRTGWNKGGRRVNAWIPEEFAGELEKMGFLVKTESVGHLFFKPNRLFVARRKES